MPQDTPVDDRNVGQRLVTLAAACSVAPFLAAAAPGAGTRLPNWAGPQISTVVSHGLMAKTVRQFRPNAVLTRGTLADLSSGLEEQLGAPPATTPPDPGTGTTGTTTTVTTGTTTTPTTGGTSTTPSGPADTPMTMAQLDQTLVLTLGLKKAAKE